MSRTLPFLIMTMPALSCSRLQLGAISARACLHERVVLQLAGDLGVDAVLGQEDQGSDTNTLCTLHLKLECS